MKKDELLTSCNAPDQKKTLKQIFPVQHKKQRQDTPEKQGPDKTMKQITDPQKTTKHCQQFDVSCADHTKIIKESKKQNRKGCTSQKKHESPATQAKQLKNESSKKTCKNQGIGYDPPFQILKNGCRHQKAYGNFLDRFQKITSFSFLKS